ncbi:MAG: aminoglycoside 6-adenylyltransferase [Ruminococcaceae bacterium]|nr:aminoglycoside 6-adenylyltransferase [Oscillospiraceae bacterium]
MSKFRTEREMLDLIINTAKEDDRILGVMMNGSRADVHVEKDIYRDYDIVYFVKDVAPFWNNTAWLEEKFGKIAVLQTPETGTLLPPDNNGDFVFLTIFEDGNRIDLSITSSPYIDDGEPAIVLLDKTGELSGIKPRDDFWFVKLPTEKLFRDCCNEFWWCLNNVAKGIARDELPYAMEMFNHYVRDMLNQMTDWYIGVNHDFKVSAGKMGKNYKRYLPEELYKMYAATYSDSGYAHLWTAVFTGCELFRTMAKSVAERFGYVYNISEDENMTEYMLKVKEGKLK